MPLHSPSHGFAIAQTHASFKRRTQWISDLSRRPATPPESDASEAAQTAQHSEGSGASSNGDQSGVSPSVAPLVLHHVSLIERYARVIPTPWQANLCSQPERCLLMCTACNACLGALRLSAAHAVCQRCTGAADVLGRTCPYGMHLVVFVCQWSARQSASVAGDLDNMLAVCPTSRSSQSGCRLARKGGCCSQSRPNGDAKQRLKMCSSAPRLTCDENVKLHTAYCQSFPEPSCKCGKYKCQCTGQILGVTSRAACGH